MITVTSYNQNAGQIHNECIHNLCAVYIIVGKIVYVEWRVSISMLWQYEDKCILMLDLSRGITENN